LRDRPRRSSAAIEARGVTRELVLATGMEHRSVVLRRRDPEASFDHRCRCHGARRLRPDDGDHEISEQRRLHRVVKPFV
jgi:hypothetical protein